MGGITELLAVFDVLAALPDRDALVASPAQRRLRATLAPVLGHDAYDGYFLLDRQGRALASSRDENVFEDHSLAGAWVGTGRTLAGESILSLPLPSRMQLDNAEGIPTAGRPTQFVGAPSRTRPAVWWVALPGDFAPPMTCFPWSRDCDPCPMVMRFSSMERVLPSPPAHRSVPGA